MVITSNGEGGEVAGLDSLRGLRELRGEKNIVYRPRTMQQDMKNMKMKKSMKKSMMKSMMKWPMSCACPAG